MPVSFTYAYARPLHSDMDREEQEKYPFLMLCGKMGYSLMTARAPQDRLITVKKRNGDYASFSELSNTLKNVLS